MSATAEVDSINTAISEEKAPVMQLPLSTEATLIRGLWNAETSQFDTLAQVREMDGSDEEALAVLGAKEDTSYGEYLTTLLGRTVLSIGDTPITNAKVLDTLINGDRDVLFLAVIRATYGTTRTVQAVCNACNQKNDIEIELDKDFPVTLPDFPIDAPIVVKGRKHSYSFNIPTGADTTAASKAKNDAEANSIILSRCAVFDPKDEPSDRLEWARKINLGDRHKIVDRLLSIELGPKLGVVDTHCAHCDVDMPISLNWVSLLLG